MKKLLLILVLALSTGCVSLPASGSAPAGEDALIRSNYHAVDQLLNNAAATRGLSRQRPIVVASLVGIDDLRSSRLGRTISEQLATRLTKGGYQVVELKLRESIFVKQMQGELLLSREVKEISTSHQAQAVLVGTYAVANGKVYVTVKLVGMNDNVALAAHDYVLPMDANVRFMLWKSGQAAYDFD